MKKENLLLLIMLAILAGCGTTKNTAIETEEKETTQQTDTTIKYQQVESIEGLEIYTGYYNNFINQTEGIKQFIDNHKKQYSIEFPIAFIFRSTDTISQDQIKVEHYVKSIPYSSNNTDILFFSNNHNNLSLILVKEHFAVGAHTDSTAYHIFQFNNGVIEKMGDILNVDKNLNISFTKSLLIDVEAKGEIIYFYFSSMPDPAYAQSEQELDGITISYTYENGEIKRIN